MGILTQIMDKYNLERFIEAQEQTYEHALQEIRRGCKSGHWIWYIFPQLRGLGKSRLSDYYGIEDLQEATDYLSHPVLGWRLCEITEALLVHSDKNIEEIFRQIDAKKVCSSMTLFDAAFPNYIFRQVLDEFYNGEKDRLTLKKLNFNKPLFSANPAKDPVGDFVKDPVEETLKYKAIEKQVER